jgi:hypothetical protein
MASAAPGATSIRGFYGPSSVADGSFMVYLTEKTTLPIGKGWTVSDLPGITGNVYIQTYNSNVYGDVVINPGPPAISFPYVSNAVVFADMPNAVNVPSSIVRLTLSPPTLTSNTANATTTFGLYDPRLFDASKIVGDEAPLRDLGSNVETREGLNEYTTLKDRGAGTGALIALSAFAPQDEYLFSNVCSFLPSIRQHTRFAQYHSVTPLIGPNYIGQTVTVELRPNEHGDLLTNMYLALTLPPLMDASWTNPIGRAIFEKVEFIVDNQVIEKITDDWYIIHDQLFLDADEKLAMYKAINGGAIEGNDTPATQPLDLMIPLDFFFTRRHSYETKTPQRIEVPGFPLCSVWNQKVLVRFTFRPQTWFTNYVPAIEFINPRLITEEIMLSNEERLYYTYQPFDLIVNHVENNSAQTFKDGVATFNLTANYSVIMLAFFIRRSVYEKSATSTYYGSRYYYGYTNQYYVAGVPLTLFDGSTSSYLDPIEYCSLFLNGQDILGTFATGTYFTYKQPMEHGLSVPTKRLNSYVFGFSPKEFNQGGFIDFKKINSATSTLSIKFLKDYAPDIASNFSINLYYYGYKKLTFGNGFATLVS